MRLVLALVLLHATVAAAAAPDEARQVGRTTVRAEPSQYRGSGEFIGPNEHLGHLFKSVLKKLPRDGALISVGTIRTFDRSARLRRALGRGKTFLLDYDGVTTTFNARLVDELKRAPDRRALLAGMFVGTASGDVPHSNRARIVADQEAVGRGDLEASWTDRGYQNYYIARYFKSFVNDHPVGWRRTILGSDKLFRIAKAQAERGELIPIQGSIGGDHTMPDIAAALRAGREKVSVVDLSNALQHVVDRTPRGTLKKVIANLKRLPLHEDAMILMTELDYARPASERKGDSYPWTYYAVPARTLLAAARRGMLEEDYRSFLHMARTHRRAGDPAELVVPDQDALLREIAGWSAKRSP
jgi:hypothetical protein